MILFDKSESEFELATGYNELLNSSLDECALLVSEIKRMSMSENFYNSIFLDRFKSINKTQEKYDMIELGPIYLYKVKEVYLFPSYGVICSKRGAVYKTSFEEARWVTPTKVNLPHVSIKDEATNLDLPDKLLNIESAFVCMPLGATVNYGHFIIDCLTSISVHRDFIENNNIPIVFPKLNDWQKAHLELLNIKTKIIEVKSDIISIDKCYYSNTMDHFLHRSTIDISDMANSQIKNIDLSNANLIFPKKIFITRKNHELRKFEQENALAKKLEKFGFEAISPEDYSVVEQILMFRDAEFIIGATGAGFANAVYCSPGCVVVEIMPNSFDGNIWVRNLCALRRCYWMPILVPEKKPADQVYVEGVLREVGGIEYDPNYNIDIIIDAVMPLIKLHYKKSYTNNSELCTETDNLKELAIKHKTDKQGAHNYAHIYDSIFSKIRFERLKILEIGIGGYDDPKAGGESLRMWKEYFPNSLIVGLDYYEKSDHQEDRIITYKGSQDDHSLLNLINEELGHFDVIIDDGSHMNSHVLSSFKFLFPLLKNGGIYAIEDIQTSYWKKVFDGSSKDFNLNTTTMGYIKSLVDGINYKEYEIPNYKPSYLDKNIISIQFFHNQIFIFKGNNNEESNVVVDNTLPDAYSSFR